MLVLLDPPGLIEEYMQARFLEHYSSYRYEGSSRRARDRILFRSMYRKQP